MGQVILAIDQGTSGSKAVLFSPQGKIHSKATAVLNSAYPASGYVEQDPEEIYTTVLQATGDAVTAYEKQGGQREDIVCCGISNQRETFLLWDAEGRPLRPAVVWQCKRSVPVCERLQREGAAAELKQRTGLMVDPYFSGTKLTWIIENEPEIATAIGRGEVLFGTVDTWLLYRLTGGDAYASDYTNASRTLFMNLDTLEWDPAMLQMLAVEGLRLPQLNSSSARFGESSFQGTFARPIPITAMIGDSHAAAFGERCVRPGTAKATLGTGSSILMNTGPQRPVSEHGMVETVCWSAGDRVDYALEGIIVSCGSTITWLRDQMGLFRESHESDALAESVPDNGGVYLVPAFAGLGAPYWKMDQTAVVSGLTFATGKAHVVRAGLESIAYQVKDVVDAMELDSGIALSRLQIDGGLTKSSFVMPHLANVLEVPVAAIELTEASAFGAALLAGLGAGIYSGIDEIAAIPYTSIDYHPQKQTGVQKEYQMWKKMVRTL
ncbi:MAG: glycerol kinase GlpK [Spirochaetia bacterium]